MMAEFIPLADCKHGYVYAIRSRNLLVGVFRETTGGFIGIREKFGNRYLFEEYHYDNGPPFGTVRPMFEIEQCPITPISEHLGTECRRYEWPDEDDDDDAKPVLVGGCGRSLAFTKTDPNGTGVWLHEDGTPRCEGSQATSIPNRALFDYLKPLDEAESERDVESRKDT